MSDHSITSLIEKLEGAEVGSRELDHEVLLALGYVYHMDFGPHWYARPGRTERVFGNGPSQVTTSLDAVLSQAERIFPDGWVDLYIHGGLAKASQCFEGNRAYWAIHKSNAISVCIAILRAQSEARV